jgi:hypothetical protein
MKASSRGVALMAALALWGAGCGDSGGTPTGQGGQSGSAAGTGAAGLGGGGSGVGGSAVAGAWSGSGGTAAAAGMGPTPCKVLGEGATGDHGLTLIYESPTFGAFYSPVGIDGDKLYFTSRGTLLSYPLAGGDVAEVATLTGSKHVVRGGTLYWLSSSGVEMTGSILSAPLSDLSAPTTLVESIATPRFLQAADQALYFNREDPAGIFKLVLTETTPQELVSMASPLGMIVHDGYVYWLDFSTNSLERVPVNGGQRERLVDVHFGGPMAASAQGVFWADTSLNTVERWTEGMTTSHELWGATSPFNSPEYVSVVGDTVYWVLGFNCGELYTAKADGSGVTRHTQGTDGANWVAATDTHVFILGRGGLYRADR